MPYGFSADVEEVIRLWVICDEHARDYVGMAGVPTGIRLGETTKLCELYGHGTDMLEKILYLDAIAYPIKYPPKKS
jgi:hypothetical protein